MSQGKQLNVNLSFTADSSQAKRQIQDLQQALQNIAKLPGKATSLFDDKQIKEASNAALELQQHLQKAVNVNTGNLDLSRLSTSLKASGQTLDQYYNKLIKVGPEGQAAFMQLAKSISTAEAPVTRMNKRFEEFATTLKNTARWQISSSILHGFMGTLQSAYHYAQNLNESLNNIRIVTGQSVDQMASFAKSANESAKALSTTTTAYTDAALIYYQQGLSDSEVKERTDVTVKMANVARESAQEVSDQMTAVWNNFNKDGTESAEHFADVMTKLGAETASSTDEIAEGLSKFAGIADTVGLSFDYATSALATITATSRESADVVGTALKTIFGRMEGLKLGETLEDGTDLTKYSQALQVIGVDIKTANGELKDMDTILDETGQAWQKLSEDQKVATAQTVAGVRQYSQFMTLMDNWNFMQENLARTQNAEGTLQEQADIYAESWEAAQKRVRAAAEGIYDSLISDDFFITLLNGFAKFIEMIDGTIDSLGGLKGVLASVGSIFLSYYSNKMPEALNNLKQNFMVMTGQATQAMKQMQQQNGEALSKIIADPKLSSSYKIQAEGMYQVNEMQQKLVANSRNMTEAEQADYRMRMQNVQAMYEELSALEATNNQLAQRANITSKNVSRDAVGGISSLIQNYNNTFTNIKKYDQLAKQSTGAEQGSYERMAYQAIESQEQLELQINDVIRALQLEGNAFEEITLANGQITPDNQRKLEQAVQGTIDKYQKLITQSKSLETLSNGVQSQAKQWKEQEKAIEQDSQAIDKLKNNMKQYLSTIQETANQNGFKIAAEDIEKINASLANGGIKQAITDFQSLSSNIDVGVNTQIDELEQNILQLENVFDSLGLSGSKNFEMLREQLAQLAEGRVKLQEGLSNIRGQGSEDPSGLFSLSKAMTEFGSAAMATYTVIQSFSNGMKTLQDYVDGTATGMEALGAVTSMLMSSMMAVNSVTQLATTLSKSETVAKLAQGAANQFVAVTAGEAAVAEGAMTAAAAPLLPIILAIVAAMGALVGIGYGVVKAFQAIKDASPEGQLAKAKEEAQLAADAYDKVSEGINNANSELSNYQSARDALSEMTTGTEEWAAAVSDLNNKVLDLINKYPELAQGLDISNGVLAIDEKVMQDFTTELRKQQALAAVVKADQADTTKQESAISRKDNYNTFASEKTGNIIRGYGIGVDAKGNLSSFGSRGEMLSDLVSFEDYGKILESVKTEGVELLENTKALQEATGISAEAAKAIAESETAQGQISAQVNEEKSKQLAAEAQRTAAISNLLLNSGNERYNQLVSSSNQQDNANASMVSGVVARNTGENSEIFNQINDSLNKLSDNDIFKQYVEDMYNLTEGTTEWKEALDAAKEAGRDAIQGQLADLQSTAEFTDQNLDQIIQKVESLNTSNGLKQFFGSEQIDASQLFNFDKNIIQSGNKEDILELFKVNESDLKELGYKSADDFIRSCQEKLDSAKLDTSNIKNELKTDGEDLVTSFADISNKVEELDPLKKIYDKMAEGKGMDWKALTSDAKGSFSDIFKSYTKEYEDLMQAIGEAPNDLSKQQKAWDKLVTAWIKGSKEFKNVTKETAEAAKNSLKDMGVTNADSIIDSFLKEEKAAQKLAKQYKKLSNEVENYSETLKLISKGGISGDLGGGANAKDLENYTEAIEKVKEALSEITGTDVSFNTAQDFLTSSTENAELLEAALHGDADALNHVKTNMAALSMLRWTPEMDTSDFYSDLWTLVNNVQNANLDAEGHAKFDSSDFLNKWAQMAIAAGASANQIKAALNSIPNIEAEITYQTVALPQVSTQQFASSVRANKTQSVPGVGYVDTKTGVSVQKSQTIRVPSIRYRQTGGGGGNAGIASPAANYGGSGGGGGGKGGSCFAAGTLVAALNETKNIENIEVGDIVLSYNEKTMQNEYSQVLETMIHDTTEDIYTLSIGTDKLEVTGIHKFFILRDNINSWIEASQLQKEDQVLYSDGSYHSIDDIAIEEKSLAVYNFEVSNNHNYYVGKNQILVHNKGGGGGGGKAKEPDTMDKEEKVKDKPDRYRNLNEQLKKLDHTLAKLENKQEHLFGQELIKSLQKENGLLSKRRATYQKLNKELGKERKELQKDLKKYGAEFDKKNNLTNYKETFKNIKQVYNDEVEHYNKMVDKYNHMSAKEQESYKKKLESEKKQLEKQKEKYEQAKEYLTRYDEVMDEIRKNDEERQQILYEMIENNLQSFEIKYQVQLDIKEAKRKWNDFLRDTSNSFRKTFKANSDWMLDFDTYNNNADTYIGDNGTLTNLIQEAKDINQNIEAGVFGKEGSLFVSESEAIEKYKEVSDNLLDAGSELFDLYQNSWDTYLDSIDQYLEQFDKLIDRFDQISDTLDHNKEIIEMLYGGENTSTGRKALSTYYAQSRANSLAKQSSIVSERDKLVELQKNTTVGEEDYTKYQEQIDALNSELNDEIENYLDILQGQLENSVSIERAGMDQNTWGQDFSRAQEQWNDRKAQAEGYYDQVQKIYQLESLESKWQAAITSTSSVKTQKQLTELMERQQKALKDKVDLSEKDIDLALKELEVYKAQIALEEAQQNKNSMKLVRNEQGDWSYQYVADQSDVSQKQEDYLAKVDEWRTASINAAEDITEKIMNSYQEFSDKLTELMTDVSLTQEEISTRYTELYNTYWGSEGIISKAVEDSNYVQRVANEATFIELAELYRTDRDNFDQMTKEEKALIEELEQYNLNSNNRIRDFLIGADANSGFYKELIDGANKINVESSAAWSELASNIKDNYNDVKEKVGETYDAMNEDLKDYNTAVGESEEASKTSWRNVTAEMLKTTEQTQKAQKAVEDYCKTADKLNDYLNEVEKVRDKWESVKDEIADAIELQNELMNRQAGNTGKTDEDPTGNTGGEGSKSSSSKQSTKSTGTKSSSSSSSEDDHRIDSNTSKVEGVASAIWFWGNTAGWGNGAERERKFKEKKVTGAQDYINKHARNGDIYNKWNGKKDKLKKYFYGAFETGGYTGEWNDGSGKLALLHSKEIVLNKEDTRNLLDTISLVRDITHLGSSINEAISNGISSMVSGLLNMGRFNGINSVSDGGSKVFNITAEFPNANSVEDIQEAILSLPTLANQYISANQ